MWERSASSPRLAPERLTKISTPGRFTRSFDDPVHDPAVDVRHQPEPLRGRKEDAGRDELLRPLAEADEGLVVDRAPRVADRKIGW